MNSKCVERLLERYWQREISLEKEVQLCTFFMEGDVPGHLLRYKDLFVYQQLQQEERLGMDFDIRVPAGTRAPVVRTRYMTLTARFMPLFKATVAVVVVLSLSSVMQHSFFSGVKEAVAASTIDEQISVPSVALSGDMVVTHEKQIMDSLHRVNKEKEVKE